MFLRNKRCRKDIRQFAQLSSVGTYSRRALRFHVHVVSVCDLYAVRSNAARNSFLRDTLYGDTSHSLRIHVKMDYTPQQLKRLYLRGVISIQDFITFKRIRRDVLKRDLRLKPKFTLDSVDSTDCELLFRFSHSEIRRLFRAFEIPELISLNNRVKVPGKTL